MHLKVETLSDIITTTLTPPFQELLNQNIKEEEIFLYLGIFCFAFSESSSRVLGLSCKLASG